MGAQKETEILNGLLSKAGDQTTKTPLAPRAPMKSIEDFVKDLSNAKGSVEKYREVQSIELTKIQRKILDAITDDKLESASLTELTRAYVLLKDKELVMNGKATAITGIVGYLIQLEKEDLEKKDSPVQIDTLEADYSVCDPEEEEKEEMPNL